MNHNDVPLPTVPHSCCDGAEESQHEQGGKQEDHLSVCDVLNIGSLEGGLEGVAKQLGVVAAVEHQPVDVCCVSQLRATQQDLVGLYWRQPGGGATAALREGNNMPILKAQLLDYGTSRLQGSLLSLYVHVAGELVQP